MILLVAGALVLVMPVEATSTSAWMLKCSGTSTAASIQYKTTASPEVRFVHADVLAERCFGGSLRPRADYLRQIIECCSEAAAVLKCDLCMLTS